MIETTEERQRPFVIALIGWVTCGAGALLVTGGVYRIVAGMADAAVYAVLAAGVAELIAGANLGFGVRWAYRVMRILAPLNFLASCVLVAATQVTDFVLWPVVFGAVTFALYGPARYVGRMHEEIDEWLAVVEPATAPVVASSPSEPRPERLAA